MARASHENPEVLDLMVAPLRDQVQTLTKWGMPDTGLLILMSPCLGRCFFCAQPEVTHMPDHMITPPERVVRWFEGSEQLTVRRLCIGGTEPTTHGSFESSLHLAQSHGFTHVQLMTSGVRLAEPETLTRWFSLGLREVCVPLYSADPRAHDAIVKVPGQAEQVLAGLDAAKAMGITVRVHTLALKRTLMDLPRLAAMVRERFGTTLVVTPLREKEVLFSYTRESVSYGALGDVLRDVPAACFGFPTCALPGVPVEAPEVIQIYFRGQATIRPETTCQNCRHHDACLGAVPAHLRVWGDTALQASPATRA